MRLMLTDETSVQDALYSIKQALQQLKVADRQISEFITLTSELCYNAIRHGSDSTVDFHLQTGVAHLEIYDSGKGFSHLGERAFKEGFSTADTLGLGLGGVVRMADEFNLETSTHGTRVSIDKRVKDA